MAPSSVGGFIWPQPHETHELIRMADIAEISPKANGVSVMSLFGRLARLPLRLVPHNAVVPIMTGKLRGARWIVGSAIHRCWLGFYEYDKQRMIAKRVKSGTVFYDVGANAGFYTLLASRLVADGSVFAFEPVPRNLSYLRKHIAINRTSNVEVLDVAVSDANGTASFEVENTGYMGHLTARGGIEVATVTLDSLVAQGKILPPNFIKMDIEGAELAALQGASNIFQCYRPVLFLATHGRAVHTECRQLLESWGYDWRELGFVGDFGEVISEFRKQRAA